MKHKIVLLCAVLLLFAFCLHACGEKPAYVPTGEFYQKTSPSIGDGGASDVIDLEAEHLTYQGTGDITVSMTVGFGHMPVRSAHEPDPNSSFAVHISVYGFPFEKDEPAWETTLQYDEDWDSVKFNATEPEESHPFLIFPHYGDFYPLYKENVQVTFPAELERGVLFITVSKKQDGMDVGGAHCRELRVDFYREGDVLTLESED